MNKKYLNPLSYVRPLGSRGYLNWMPDSLYLKLCYRAVFHKKLDLKKPRTFTEKLQWLKLYNRDPVYGTLVDKVAVRDYVTRELSGEYLIPLVGGPWSDPEEIDFDDLPHRFVLKCNHGSSTNIICKDKSALDVAAAKAKLRKWMGMNWFWHGREWPYKDLKPCIYAEAYMEDEQVKELRDYKFFCFDGSVQFFKIDFDRYTGHRANYYGRDKELMPFGELNYPPDYDRQIHIPEEMDEMICLAEKIAAGHPFLRVDFYVVNHKIYFGEITFFPTSGFGKFTTDEWDKKLGDLIPLP